ncbi:sulfatase family protein [Rhodopirellula sp. JC639]|uniref:sulfatase family protein n=1 Tax=Stieleria mannarensis TaxID=2755585 RepID=UPI0015FF5F68
MTPAPVTSHAKADSTDHPNIVVILADDMGWGDPQCYQADSQIPTPNLDRLAAGGMRFTDAHTPSSVCTPTRYTLLTGRYCWRTSLTKGVLDGFAPPLIGDGEDTLASMLKRQGYRTACVGKWHLGMQWHDKGGNAVERRGVGVRFRPGDEIDFECDISGGPNDLGFDSYFGISASLDMAPYVFIRDRRVETLPTERHQEIDGTIFLNGVSGVKSAGFDIHDVLPRFGDEAVNVIESHTDRDQPLFLYLPLSSPHLPIAPSAGAKGKSNAGDYGDFVWETDHVVGRVLDALERAGMTANTMVVFTSDNGGLWHWWDFRADDDGGKAPITPRGQYVKDFNHQSNAHLRGTKADIYEGGHRVPFIVRWPARVKAGQVSSQLVELTDVFATVADITSSDTLGDSGRDSISFLPLLGGEAGEPRSFSVHHSVSGVFALRQGNWKLIEGRGSGGFTRPKHAREFEDSVPGQLYDLHTDPREQHNRWTEQAERVDSMRETLQRIRGRVHR